MLKNKCSERVTFQRVMRSSVDLFHIILICLRFILSRSYGWLWINLIKGLQLIFFFCIQFGKGILSWSVGWWYR